MKKRLFEIFSKITALVNDYKEKARRIREDVELTPDGRKKRIDALKGSSLKQIEELREQALKVLAEARDKLQKDFVASGAVLKDPGYQAGLMNVLKMLELHAVNPVFDFPVIIETYKGDQSAINAIKAICMKYDENHIDAFMKQIPADTRQITLNLYDQIEKDINQLASEKSLAENVNVSLNRSLQENYLYSKLNDDLMIEVNEG